MNQTQSPTMKPVSQNPAHQGNPFKKAERKQAKLKIALTGPSGSGKTYSALSLAQGLGQKIALIDTENSSASLYSDRFTFDILDIQPPYTVQKYLGAIQAAVSHGYDVLIVDSLSHAWAGDGGLLAKKEGLDARGGNSYTNWASISKEHEAFKALILNSDIHLIATMRSKQDYVVEMNDKGKSAPRKVGMAPIQRDGMEYEFTVVFDISMSHEAAISKDRTGLFDGEIFKINSNTGKKLTEWLSTAQPAPVAPKAPAFTGQVGPLVPSHADTAHPSEAQLKRLFAISRENDWTHEQVKAYLLEVYGIASTKELTLKQYDELCMSTIPSGTYSWIMSQLDLERQKKVSERNVPGELFRPIPTPETLPLPSAVAADSTSFEAFNQVGQ